MDIGNVALMNGQAVTYTEITEDNEAPGEFKDMQRVGTTLQEADVLAYGVTNEITREGASYALKHYLVPARQQFF
jgi:hypothetical protein